MPHPIHDKRSSATLGPSLFQLLWEDVKGLAAFWTKAKYRKVSIEGRNPVNTEAPHQSEAGAIDNRKILVRPRNPDVPGNLQVSRINGFDYRDPSLQALPKPLGSFPAKPVAKQRPCFDQNVVRRYKSFA
jgi:hypothetical protein